MCCKKFIEALNPLPCFVFQLFIFLIQLKYWTLSYSSMISCSTIFKLRLEKSSFLLRFLFNPGIYKKLTSFCCSKFLDHFYSLLNKNWHRLWTMDLSCILSFLLMPCTIFWILNLLRLCNGKYFLWLKQCDYLVDSFCVNLLTCVIFCNFY